MKTKFLKQAIAIICIMAMVLPISSTVLAKITQTAKDTEQKFGITLLHQSSLLSNSSSKVSFAYKLDTRNTYRIYAGSNDFETTIVCLNKDGKFPQEDGASTGTYKSLGTATAATLKEAYANIDANKSSQILWLIKNAVLPEDSSELKDIKLSKIYKSIIDTTASTENPVTLSQIKQYLTEDDLVFAYQCAIWQATNYSTVTNADNAEILSKVYQGNSTGNDSDWDGLEGNDRWGYKGRKGTYIKEMIRFYINNFSTSNNIVPTSTDTTVKPKITVPTSTEYEKKGSKIFAGPFKIESSQSGKQTSDYAVDITFKDASGNNLSVSMGATGYILTTTNETNTTLLSPTKASLEGKEFYFAFPLNTKVREININLSVGNITTTSEGTVWVAKDGNNMQPLLTVSRTETLGESVKANYKFNVTTTTNYDVALRKYIATIYRGNKIVYDGEKDKKREPVVHTPTDTNPFNQQEYYHSKNPIQVEVGDRVVYGIVLYNEGEDTVRISQVIDHLPPSGIEFIDGKTKQLQDTDAKNTECTQAGRNIVYEKTNSYICELSKGSKSKPIYFEFEVTAAAKGKIVTNIAEITGMTDTSGNPLDSDIDSAPNNAKLPTTEDEWQNYQGNSNKSDLTDKNYYYKGYEDDDDFEKITVPADKKIDLALRKSIETVNGVSQNRAKAPDTSPLTDNNESTTTSNFSDIKTPVEVKVGDIVIYTIRVFNEGNTDAYASKITDYIPSGLGVIVNHNVNTDNQWQFDSNASKIKLSEIANAVGNLNVRDFNKSGSVISAEDLKNVDVIKGQATITTSKLKDTKLTAFDTNKRLDIHTVQVACVVLEDANDKDTLRNVAAITEYKDESGNVITKDIDSNSNNDLSNFDENNHEDDEDFEKLLLNKPEIIYDLALKKYVSALKDDANKTKTIPDNQKRNLSITDVTELENRAKATDKADAKYSFGLDKATTPVIVKKGDTVEYTLRIYNEGKENGIAEEIIDTVPDGLEFLPDSEVNIKYGWEEFKDQNNTGWTKGIKTKYLKNTAIPGFNSSESNATMQQTGVGAALGAPIKTDKGVSYVELKIEFKVITDEIKQLKNIAEITKDDGDDNDSTPNNKNEKEDDEDFDVIVPEKEPEIIYDLALKKYVSALKDDANKTKTIPDNQKRNLSITDVTELENRAKATDKADAKYSFGLDKSATPVIVKKGDTVEYTLRIYNEGKEDGKAEEIIDTVPAGLEFLPNSEVNKKYGWKEYEDQTNSGWTKGIKTEYLKNTTIPGFNSDASQASMQYESSDVPVGIDKGVSYVELKIEFKVVTDEIKQLKNIAEITKDDGDDNDSTPNNKNEKEDDEDFDVIVPEKEIIYDLALKKYVSSVIDATNNTKEIPANEKRTLNVINVDALEKREKATDKADAIYSFGTDKEQVPVTVSKGDSVVYTIRIYNEGKEPAKAEELIDTVPAGLEFLPNSAINKKYGWKEYEDTNNSGWTKGIKTEYLKNTTIPGFDTSKKNDTQSYNEETGIGIDKGVSYAEVKIEFKVTTDELKQLKNIAEITKDDGDDNDSTPNNKDEKEDDEDFDVIIPKKFDLSLRKFITKIDDTNVTDRVPKVDTTELDNGTSTTAKYEHTKEPKVVVKGQIVIYTLRIYNEGTQDGYASEITDDLPEGITFLPNNETNKTYRWKMYDKDGKETDNVVDAVKIKTDYGAKENGKEATKPDDYTKEKYPYYKSNSNLLLAYNKATMKDGPDYIDVKVAFEVTQDSVTAGKKVIINTAEISKNTDKDGKDIEDVDSTPGNSKEDEDDIDKEYLVLKYFDLSLLKYVSKVIVTEDGVTKETETGYDGTENPEPIVKVELNRKKLDKTEVKYVYSIKITNEGEIEGYAKEIKDRIPDGLAFFEEDNTQYNWKILENGIVTTDYLKDTLLKPGESAVVPIVLRWTRSENNLGQKVNVAEISKDYNDYGAPDIDSTPDNNKDGEDDQDLAIVVLSISTGSAPMYIALITFITALLGVGSYMIYKYVIKE